VNLVLAAGPWEGGKGVAASWLFRPRYELRGGLPVVAGQRLRIPVGERRDRAFAETITGVYPLPRGSHQALLELPRPLNTLDHGGRVEVLVDETARGQELLVHQAGAEEPVSGTQRYTFTSETAPTQVRLAWRPYLLDLPVAVEADLTLDRRGLVHLEQRVHLPAAPEPVDQALFRFPAGHKPDAQTLQMMDKSLKVTADGKKVSVRLTTAGLGPVPLAERREARTVALAYDFPLPASGEVQVPLLWLDKAARVETKVRVWDEPRVVSGTLAAVKKGPHWQKQPTEDVPRHDSLPLLVLRGIGRDLPLTLELWHSDLPPLATALVQRALIQATVGPDGSQNYHARFRVSQWNTRTLEVVLPVPGARLTMALLAGEKLEVKPTAGNAALFTLPIDPGKDRKSTILELHYQITPDSADGENPDRWAFINRLRTTLHPPVLRGAVFLGRVRWLVELPSGRVVLNPGGDATTEETWGVRGWLLGPLPAMSPAQLLEWLTETRGRPDREENEAALVCWQHTPAPLHLVHVAQKSWMLVCSVLLLALGLGLSFVPLTRGPFRVVCWTVAVVVGAAAATALVLWPSILPLVVYGCEPGAAVLAVVLLVQWTLQRRYRRQLVFMPGFTRLKPGSALIRTGGGSGNRPREPSTVDAPTSPDNSANRGPAP
jgi:hypothetical protein